MGRISATLKPTTEKIAKAYRDFHELTFSEAIQILTAVGVNQWWVNLEDDVKAKYVKKYKIGGKK